MRKSLFVLVVLGVLATAVPADAQYIPQTWEGMYYRWNGNEAQMLVADNLGMVDGLNDQLHRAGYRSLARDIYWNGAYGAYGVPMGRGGFYPMYDRQMRPMSRGAATATGVAIGAGLGYGVSGNLRGTVIGAAGGAIVGLLTHRGRNNNQRDNGVVVTPPSETEGRPQQPVYWSNGAPVRPIVEKRSGEFQLSNSTRFKLDVYDGDTSNQANFKFRLAPGEKRGVDAPKDRFRGLALVPNLHGGISTEEFSVSPTDSGWIFVEPDVMRGR